MNADERGFGIWDFLLLEGAEVEAAVDVDDVSGGEGEVAGEDGGDGAAEVVGGSPAALGDEAVGDEVVVFFFDACGHVGGHDAGAEFDDGDSVRGEAVGPELGDHGESCFGDAVVAAVEGGDGGGEGGDEEEFVAVGEEGFSGVFEPVFGDELGEEVGALEVDAEDFVEDVLGGFGDVCADARGDAGVVDEGVDAAEGGEGFLIELVAAGIGADISGYGDEALVRGGCDLLAEGYGFLGGGAV